MHGKEIVVALVLLAAAAFAQGCATIMHGSTQQVMINSTPMGANVIVDGGMRFKTPAAISLSRKDSHIVEISMDGYQTETVDIRRVTSGAAFGNLLFGGLVGVAVDASSGGAYRLEPEDIRVDLRAVPIPVAENAPAVTDVKPPAPSENPQQ
jgi:hypothetical protein